MTITTALRNELLALHSQAMASYNDNGLAPDENGYVRSMSGDIRTVMRRTAKLLGFDAANVSSGILKSLLVAGARDGVDAMVQVAIDSSESTLSGMPALPAASDDFQTITVAATPVTDAPALPAAKTALLQQMQELMAQALTVEAPSGLSHDDVVALIQQYAPKPAEKTITIVTPDATKKLGDKLLHEKFDAVLKAVANDVPVMLVGPAGSGKTTLCEQVAEAIDLRFYFTGAVSSEYKLSGFVDAQGRIVSTAFREAYKNGGLFLFDEVDASMPQAIMAFNAALANGHCDFPGDTEPTPRHADFRVVAAANTYGRGADRQYVGRNQLDAASLDRFAVITLDYDEALETALAGNTSWAKRVQRIRREIEKQQIRHIVSPRASILGAKLLAAGLPIDDVLHATVWKGLDEQVRSRIASATA